MEETIQQIQKEHASISRFGDGEFDIIYGRSQPFQGYQPMLAKRLKQILKINGTERGFMVGLPDCFGSLNMFTPKAQLHWKIRLDKERIKWVRCLNKNSKYANAQMSRFYFDWVDKSKSQGWFQMLKGIWGNEDILLVEGNKSRLGVGNDLFDNAKSVRRILCPAENSFDKYDEILETACAIAKKGDLILIALGPTASVLAYDLFKKGFWAVDIGHVDLEYEWMKRGATVKTVIPGKYVSEVKDGNIVENIKHRAYQKQIVKMIE